MRAKWDSHPQSEGYNGKIPQKKRGWSPEQGLPIWKPQLLSPSLSFSRLSSHLPLSLRLLRWRWVPTIPSPSSPQSLSLSPWTSLSSALSPSLSISLFLSSRCCTTKHPSRLPEAPRLTSNLQPSLEVADQSGSNSIAAQTQALRRGVGALAIISLR